MSGACLTSLTMLPAGRAAVVRCNGLSAIYAAMAAHVKSSGVLERGCSAIRNVAADPQYHVDLLSAGSGAADALIRVCEAMDAFPDTVSLQTKAVSAVLLSHCLVVTA